MVNQSRSGSTPTRGTTIPVVAIGASAGGLEALRLVLDRIPRDAGLGIVVIQHLDPNHESLLARVLHGDGHLDVVEVTEGMRLRPNRVHVIPPDGDLTITAGVLRVVPRTKTGRLHLPIDTFFRSLAEAQGPHSVGVVLSGAGKDGTEGLRAIKAAGGIAIAQKPDTAQFESMPESAIATGLVDFAGTPEEIAAELARLARHPYVALPRGLEAAARESSEDKEPHMEAVLRALRQHAHIDFAGFKRSTLRRRIERRMALHDTQDAEAYAATLETEEEESKALAREMLIHVTSFFRDAEAFEALAARVFPAVIARQRETGEDIRVWVPGCSTGEEAYSIAIGLLEASENAKTPVAVKIFGSDLSEEAIATARLGQYRDSGTHGVSDDRLTRFFERIEGGYRVGKRVRDLCVFARHDLTRDPPFAKLDLVSCRNVLIYFVPEMQKYVLGMIHHCLNASGHLFLGTSETVATSPELYESVDKDHRIYMKSGDRSRFVLPPSTSRAPAAASLGVQHRERLNPAREAQRQADHLLLTRYAPPAVVVNDRLEIVQYRGRTGAFLEPPPGQPQVNLLKMAREGLVPHLHDAIERAKSQNATIRKAGIRVERVTDAATVDLEVIPIPRGNTASDRYYLVLFQEHGAAPQPGPPPRPGPRAIAGRAAEEVERLQGDLVATKDYLEALVAEHQSTSDELAATNEELVAANEELQSANEELQSAKEELQSTNEELSTVNEQLQIRNRELDQTASDLVNILSSVEIPVIIVDLHLCIRRFTPTIREVAHLLPDDKGRPLDDLKLRLPLDDLEGSIRRVLESLTPREWEAQRHDGRWFRVTIRPYRTPDNRLDGAVLTFVDIDVNKKALFLVEDARDYARSIVETVPVALMVLDRSFVVQSANSSFGELFALSPKKIEGKTCRELGPELFQVTAVQEVLRAALEHREPPGPVEVTVTGPGSAPRVFALSCRKLAWAGGEPRILLAIEDVTQLRALEKERSDLLRSETAARLEAERANRAKDLFLATLSHELRTPLSTILMAAQLLSRTESTDETVAHASGAIERAVKAQARLVDDLLDVSRIISGKLSLDLGPVDFAAVVEEALEIMRPSARAKALRLDVDLEHTDKVVYGDAQRLQQVVQNLLTNSIKFTPHNGSISVKLRQAEAHAELTISDTGIGIRAEVLPHLFSRFVQADSSVTRTHGGLGLGLSIVRHLVEMQGGTVSAESAGEGKGASFRVTLPLGEAIEAGAAGSRMSTDGVQGVRVLLVEDDDDTRDACAAMLRALGAEVHAAPSAASALAALDEFRAQVILSDIAMPGEDGLSFIERVRALPPERGGRIPAAAVTALASSEDAARSLGAGFQMHVAKPLDATRLATLVATLAGAAVDSHGNSP